MSNTFHYDSDLLGGSLLVRESRVIADLLLQQADNNTWNTAIVTENCLQKRTAATAKRFSQAIRKRLELLPTDFLVLLREGDDELATQTAFCAALARNLLLVEFVETVIYDAFLTQSDKLAAYQWLDFLQERAGRDSGIANWTDSSQKKTGQIVFRMLAEVGLLESTRKPVLQTITARSELVALLEKHDKGRVKTCLQVSGR